MIKIYQFFYCNTFFTKLIIMNNKAFIFLVSLLMLLPVIIKAGVNPDSPVQTESKNKKTNLKILNSPLFNIKSYTKFISRPRPVQSDNLAKVKNFVGKLLSEFGMEVREQKFDFNHKIGNYKLSNIIGTNPNSYGPYILLGAHIESTPFNNGDAAIDSASAIGIILELVRNLIKSNPKFPLMIVFFDAEESLSGKWTKDLTLLGSKYFVNNIDAKKISRAYIFDLIGGDIGKNQIAGFANMPHTFTDLLALSKINKKLYTPDEQIFLSPKDFVAKHAPEDDHVPFANKNIWSCNLIPYKFPNQHHKPTDTYENLNWKYIEIFYHVLYSFLSQIG